MKGWLAGLAALMVAGSVHAAVVKWQQDYDRAVAEAKEKKKLVMVDVYTDWCGWCKKLDRDVYAHKAVAEKLQKDFISVKINPERGSKNKQLAQKFGTRGYPHIVFVNGDGKKVFEIGGYQPPEAFLKSLDAAQSKAK